MRTLALVFAVVMLSAIPPVYAQQPAFQSPKDGNQLLEACSHVVHALDSPSSEVSLEVGDERAFAEHMHKFGWCWGYLQATHSLMNGWDIHLALLSVAGLRLSGPEKVQMALIETFPLIPENVSYGQLARVLVKWLRDHPERLHELPSFLTIDALKDAFPRKAEDSTKKPAKETVPNSVPRLGRKP